MRRRASASSWSAPTKPRSWMFRSLKYEARSSKYEVRYTNPDARNPNREAEDGSEVATFPSHPCLRTSDFRLRTSFFLGVSRPGRSHAAEHSDQPTPRGRVRRDDRHRTARASVRAPAQAVHPAVARRLGPDRADD